MSRRRVFASRSRGSIGRAQHIWADDKKLVGIDCPARADQTFPPARVPGTAAPGVRVRRITVQQQYRIRRGVRGIAVSLIGDIEFRKRFAAFQRKVGCREFPDRGVTHDVSLPATEFCGGCVSTVDLASVISSYKHGAEKRYGDAC
jgi:hypothetical protein